VISNDYLWRLSDVAFGEHSKTFRTSPDFTFRFVDADVDLDELRKILLDDLLSMFLDETVVPSLFSHAYLHNLVNHVTPYERWSDIQARTDERGEKWFASALRRVRKRSSCDQEVWMVNQIIDLGRDLDYSRGIKIAEDVDDVSWVMLVGK
jgi:hypothetical protein